MSITFRDKVRIEQIRAIEEDSGVPLLAKPPSARDDFLNWLNARSQNLQGEPEIHAALSQGPHLYRWGLGVLLLLMAGVGMATAFNALAEVGDKLNIFWILGVLLGFNWLSLLLWLGLTFLVPQSDGGIVAPAFYRLMHWLLPSKGAKSKTKSANRAFLQTALAPEWVKWHLGQVTHLVWMSYILGGFVCLLLLLATRQFDFIWESTLLGGDSFLALTEALAAPLATMQWPVPTDLQVLANQTGTAPADPAATRRTWAFFLLGCLLLYGLVPRVVAWLFCYWQLKLRQRKFKLNLSEPYYLRLQQTLWPQAGAGRVLDADSRGSTQASTAKGSPSLAQLPANALWVGIELGHSDPWPPQVPPEQLLGNIVDADTLEAALVRLKQQSKLPLAVAVAVNKPADRGLLRMLRQLLATRASDQVWLVLGSDRPVSAARFESWAKAVAETGIRPTQVVPWQEGA